MRKNQNQNQKLYAFMLVMAMLCMLFAFPVSAQEAPVADEVNTDAVLYVLANPADGAATDGDEVTEIAKEEITDGDATGEPVLTIGADEENGEGEEEVFQGNAIGKWLDKTFRTVDYAVFTAVTKLHSEVMNVIVSTLTHLGDSEVAIPLLVACVFMCFFKKTRKVGITVAFAIVLGTLFTNVILKNVCGRVRPYVSLSEDPVFMAWYNFAGAHVESDNSFPSGHTTCAFEMGMALFLSMRKKKIAWIFPTLAAIVGFTRLYLCVHYFTDVVAGVIVGTFAAFLAYFIMKAITNAIESKPALRDFDLAEKIKGLKKA